MFVNSFVLISVFGHKWFRGLRAFLPVLLPDNGKFYLCGHWRVLAAVGSLSFAVPRYVTRGLQLSNSAIGIEILLDGLLEPRYRFSILSHSWFPISTWNMHLYRLLSVWFVLCILFSWWGFCPQLHVVLFKTIKPLSFWSGMRSPITVVAGFPLFSSQCEAYPFPTFLWTIHFFFRLLIRVFLSKFFGVFTCSNTHVLLLVGLPLGLPVGLLREFGWYWRSAKRNFALTVSLDSLVISCIGLLAIGWFLVVCFAGFLCQVPLLF